jgi:hypothetical protein
MQHLEGSVTPVLYIGRTVLKGKNCSATNSHDIITDGVCSLVGKVDDTLILFSHWQLYVQYLIYCSDVPLDVIKWKNYDRHYWERNLTINVRWPWISTRHRRRVALRCSSLVVLGSDLATGVANKRNRLAFLTWANKYFVFTNTFISRPSMPL